MVKVLWLVIPILLLVYYIRALQPVKGKPILKVLLVAGTALYYLGMLFDQANPGVASIIQLSGACLFFSVVAFSSTNKQPPEVTEALEPIQPDEDSE